MAYSDRLSFFPMPVTFSQSPPSRAEDYDGKTSSSPTLAPRSWFLVSVSQDGLLFNYDADRNLQNRIHQR